MLGGSGFKRDWHLFFFFGEQFTISSKDKNEGTLNPATPLFSKARLSVEAMEYFADCRRCLSWAY